MSTRTRNRVIAGIAAAALLVAALVAWLAFTARDKPSSGGDPFDQAEAAGCELSNQPYDTREIYVQDARKCRNGGVFYVFGNNEGRDAWVEVATTFGAEVTETGDRWAYVKDVE